MIATTQEWVSKAEGDFDVACILRRSRKPSRFDGICFHCQQCAEKYLKGRLNEAGKTFAKTHDLGLLLKEASVVEPLWAGLSVQLKRLTDYGVAVRYPGTSTDAAAAREAFASCRKLRSLARASLGLKA